MKLLTRLSTVFRIGAVLNVVNMNTWQRWGMVGAMFAVIFALLAVDFSPKSISGLEVNKPSPVTVLAPRTITLIDTAKTQERRRRAAESVARVRQFDTIAPAVTRGRIADIYHELWTILSNKTLGGGERRQAVVKLLPSGIGPDDVDWILTLGRDEIRDLEDKTLKLAAPIMTDEIAQGELLVKKEEVRRRATAVAEPQAARIAGTLAAENLRVNSFVDRRKTNNAVAEAVDKVKPAIVKKLEGETIVAEGEIVTPLQEHFLRELGLSGNLTGKTFGQVAGQAIISLVIVVLALIYVRAFQPVVFNSNRLLFLDFVILVIIAMLAKGLAPLFPAFLIPVSGAAMLATILIRARAGIMMAVTSSLITGIMVGAPPYWIYAFTTSLFAVYLTAKISHRSDLTRAGLRLMLVSGIIAIAVSLVDGDAWANAAVNGGWGVIGGFAAIIITIGALQFLESAFNITTDMKLLELSNPMQPLLRELMVSAPGTYNHSIIAGNLVESVAQQVNANPLLARTGAYYHDIGKIRRPFFFVENQYGDNPHDKTEPNLSYLIIAAHVKEGIELAKKHRLPSEIIEIVSQHHGTSLMSYFYSRAKEKKKNTHVIEEHFRYGGDKPRSREAALVMLADSVEAAARALPKPTRNRIEQMVKQIVKERLRDGQLDESALTIADLQTITKGYTQTLTTMYHTRIEYPEIGATDEKRRGTTPRNPAERWAGRSKFENAVQSRRRKADERRGEGAYT